MLKNNFKRLSLLFTMKIEQYSMKESFAVVNGAEWCRFFFCKFCWVKKVVNKEHENQFSYHNLGNPESN